MNGFIQKLIFDKIKRIEKSPDQVEKENNALIERLRKECERVDAVQVPDITV
jgi:hypothetical protein